MNTPPLLLLVDDNRDNLTLLVDILSSGYQIKVANNGKRALQLASVDIPDLILLDIMMPGMNGFEVCQELKKSESLQHIPVIFISAADDVDNKVKAFSAGGVDYVNKPFQVEELEARIKTHLSLSQFQEQLQEHNLKLDQQVRRKSQQLIEAYERLTIINDTKNDFLELIAHEMRTPANGIIGLTELIMDSYPLNSEVKELRPVFNLSRDRMIETLDNALLLAQIHVTKDDYQPIPIDLSNVFLTIEDAVCSFAKAHDVLLVLPREISSWVDGDERLFHNGFKTLIKTAIKFTTAKKKATVVLQMDETHVTFTFIGEGLQLDPHCVEEFFNVFSSVRSSTYAEELGLSPVVAEKIFSLYGGKLSIKNLNSSVGVQMDLQLLRRL